MFMNAIKSNIIIMLILMSTSMFSQIDTITWQQCYGTVGNQSSDRVSGAVKFNDGYLFNIGISQEEPWITNFHGSADAWLVNTDSLGNIIWERCYGGSEGDGPTKIIPIDSNHIYLFNGTASRDGDVHTFTNEYADNWIVKINKYGDIIWENCYGGPNVEETKDALLTPDGGLIIMSRISAAGGDITNHYGSIDIWICKIDSLGNIQWEKTLGNHGMENAITMEFTSDTTFFVLANVHEVGGMVDCDCNVHPMGHLDVWLVEMDLNGNMLGQNCYGGTGNEIVRDIVKAEDGYVFAASTTSNDGDVSGLHGIPWSLYTADIWVCKIDFFGNIVWQNCLGGSEYEWPMYITQTQDSGFIIISNTSSNDGDVSGNDGSGSTLDTWVVKLNLNGELQWERCFGGIGDQKIWSYNNIIKNDDYNYVLAIQSMGIAGDVECELEPNSNYSPDAWVINIKDCSLYQPVAPTQPTGQATLCVNTDSITTYTTAVANGAWVYEWDLNPVEAGILTPDNFTARIHWNPFYEGEATIKVRSTNDCGESAWSDSIVVNTYICLGTEEHEDGRIPVITVYPNPASNVLTVKYNPHNNNGLTTIEVIDAYGRKVYNTAQSTNTQQTEINVADWAKGLYLVRLKENCIVIGNKKVVIH